MSGYIPTSGTINRTYQWNGTEWTATDISWSNINRQLVADNKIEISNNASTTTDGSSQELEINTTKYSQWGNVIYTIPDNQFEPTFSVTYDIELTAEDGTTVTTRRNVTSDITLNKNNFSNLASAKTAMINPIRILIQPRYLYVLADDDAYTGHLLID